MLSNKTLHNFLTEKLNLERKGQLAFGGPTELKELRHDILSHFFDGLNYG